MKKVQGDYIWFKEEGEVFQLKPYKLVSQGIHDIVDLDEAFPAASGAELVKVAVGEDLNELVGGNYRNDGWFIVDDSVPADHVFEAMVW